MEILETYENWLNLSNPNGVGKSLAHYAAENDDAELLAYLIGKSVPFNRPDTRGRVPVYTLLEKGFADSFGLVTGQSIRVLTSSSELPDSDALEHLYFNLNYKLNAAKKHFVKITLERVPGYIQELFVCWLSVDRPFRNRSEVRQTIQAIFDGCSVKDMRLYREK